MDFIFDFRLEPIVNALGMEEMVADGDLLDWDTFLVFFETDDTFILFEFIHSLIITFLLDQGQQLCYSLFYLLLSSSSLVLNLHLIDYVLLIPSLPHADSDYADHANTNEDSKHNEENHSNDAQIGVTRNWSLNWRDTDEESIVLNILFIQSKEVDFICIIDS